jgi:hypothetical protein
MNITKCKECGCTKDAEDRVVHLQELVGAMELAQSLVRDKAADENARLQARVEEAEALEQEWRGEAMMWEGRLTEAEAQAERRREALIEPINDRRGRPTLRGCKDCRNIWKKDGPEKHLEGCAATPEEAREKERR